MSLKRCKFLIFFLVIILISCAPQNINLQYGFGSCNQSWGWTQITLNGRGDIDILVSHGSEKLIKNASISRQKVREIIGLLDEYNFTSLEDSYINKYVIGGMCTGMYVKTDNYEKKVEVANSPVPAINVVSSVLIKALNNVAPEWYS